jgi:hypothetical protein
MKKLLTLVSNRNIYFLSQTLEVYPDDMIGQALIGKSATVALNLRHQGSRALLEYRI